MGRAREERELSLLAKVDEATIKRSIDRMNDLSRGFNAAADAETRLDRATARSEATLGDLSNETRQQVSAIRQRIAATKLDIQAQQDYLKITRKETDAIEDQTRAQDKLNKERKEGRGSGGVSIGDRAGSISSTTGAVSSLIGSQGALGGTFNIISDVTQVVEYLPRLSEALTGVKAAGVAAEGGALAATAGLGAMVTSVAIAAPALIALAVAVDQFQKTVESGKQRLELATDSNRLYYDTIQRGNQEQIRQQIQDLEAQRSAAQSSLTDIRNAANQTQEIFGVEIPKTIVASVTGLGEKARDTQTEIDELTSQITALQAASRSSQLFLDNEVDRAIIRAQRATDIRLGAETLGATGNSQQLGARRDAINREQAAIQAQIDSLDSWVAKTDEGRRAIAALEGQLIRLQEEEEALTAIAAPLIAAREKEARTIEAQKASLEKANTLRDARLAFDEGIKTLDAKTAQERLKIAEQANKDLLRIETKRLEAIADLEQDFQRADLKASTKLETDIAKIESEARDQEIDIRKDSAQRIEDIETRAARERQRIIEDYNDAANDAIQNRDAVALDAAQRTRNKALKDNKRNLDDAVKEEKRALKERLEEAKKSNRDRINDLRQSYAQERRDRLEALQQRIADINASAAQERATVAARLTEQLAALDAHYRDELQKLKDALGEQLREYNIYYGNLQTTTQEELDLLALRWEDYFRRIGQATPTSSGGGGGGVGPPPELAAKGIRNFRNGKLIVGEEGPELLNVRNGAVDVLSNSDTRSAFSGMAQAMRSSTSSAVYNSVSVGAGAFQANLSGGDPARMMGELERRIARRFPSMLMRALENGLK